MALSSRRHWTMPPAVRDSKASFSPSRIPMFQRPTVNVAWPLGVVSACSGQENTVWPTETMCPASHHAVLEEMTSAASNTISCVVSASSSDGHPTLMVFRPREMPVAATSLSQTTAPSARIRARTHRLASGAGRTTASIRIPSMLGVRVTGE